MAKYVDIQTNFTSGEIDPLLRSRIDIKQYQNGASKLTNVFVQPQGGVKRRPGLKHIYEFPTPISEPSAQNCALIPFEFSVDDSYMLLFYNGYMYPFKDNELVGDINGAGNDGYNLLAVGWQSVPYDEMSWTQSADTLILCHPDYRPIKIVRTSDNDWRASYLSFSSIPKYPYTLYNNNPSGTLTPDEISGTVTLTASSGTFHSGTSPDTGSLNAMDFAASASSTDDYYNGFYVELTGGTGSGQIRLITNYIGSGKVAFVDENWDTIPDATTTYSVKQFTPQSVGQYVNAVPQGRLKIVEYISATSVKGRTEVPFFSTDAIAQGDWDIETGYEDVWSTSKGWPSTTTFHEGRLYFGGSKSRPTTIWGSKVGFFFDFEPVEAYDDDAVEATLDTNTLNTITDIISGRELQVFTTGGEFYVPQTNQEPVTPTNFFVRTGTRNGSKQHIRVLQLDSGTMYIKRQGKSLSEFLYSDATLSYVSNNISLLSSHLLKTPRAMALRKAASTDESDLLFIVNEDDGSMAAYSLLTQQQVVAPSEIITDGEFVSVGVDVADIYVVTKRTFDGTDKYFVEVFDSSVFTDCAFTGGAASGASSLPHEGAEVNVLADGNVLGDETVSSGSVTFDRASTTSYEVGLPFDVEVTTQPVEKDIGTGTRLGFKKRIVEINAILNQTQHINLNGVLVPIRSFDTAGTLDNPTTSYTGIKTLYGVRGYSKDATVSVTQNYPLKMTLLGLEYKVATSGGS